MESVKMIGDKTTLHDCMAVWCSFWLVLVWLSRFEAILAFRGINRESLPDWQTLDRGVDLVVYMWLFLREDNARARTQSTGNDHTSRA
jgi:hypothetical protein